MKRTDGDHVAFLCLAFSLLFSGSQQVVKYLGMAGVSVYVIACIAILQASRTFFLPAFSHRVTDRQTGLLALATLAGLVAVFWIVYPFANAGSIGGGSDSDDALNLATRALLDHRFPYAIHTYLGAPATYLPGSLLLAVPFVILGNAAYQNVFWLAVWLLTMMFYLTDVKRALVFFWMTLLCPLVWQLLVTGGELLASSIYIVVFVLFAKRTCLSGQRSPWRWVAAVLLGIGLSSRVNYLLLVPVILSAAIQRVGCKDTARYAAATGGALLAVTLPAWLHDPDVFWVACLREQNWVAIQMNGLFTHADIVLPLLSAVFAVVLSFRRLTKPWQAGLLAHCALTQAFPVIIVVLLTSFRAGKFDLTFTAYGLHFLFFGLFASWNVFAGRHRSRWAIGASTV